MSMTPIVTTPLGEKLPLTFMLLLASLNAVLTTAELSRAFLWQDFAMEEAFVRAANWYCPPGAELAQTRTTASWAGMLAASPPAATSLIPDDQIRSILREALVGGGMATAKAIDTAERIWRNQLNRTVDFLAAQIVNACIAAG